MELIKFLQQRVSYHVHELSLPAPAGCDLETILQTAMSTPDHGNLNPWHFLVIARRCLLVSNIQESVALPLISPKEAQQSLVRQ